MKKTASILLALAMIASAVGLGSCGSDSKGGQVSIQATTEPELKDEFGVGFKVSDDGTLSVSSYTSDDKDVSIPDEFDGKPVKSVGQSAFKGQDITTVTMPDGLEKIGGFSFALCTKLEVANIPEGVKSIGANAFFADFALTEIELPESLQTIDINAFNATGLKEIVIPKNVTSIGEFAFADCTTLEQIQFSGKDTVVASNAFKGCDKLTIVAPKGSPVEDVAKENKIDFIEL